MGTGSYLYRFIALIFVLEHYLALDGGNSNIRDKPRYISVDIYFKDILETSQDIFSGGERSELDLHSTFNTGAP